MITKVPVLPGVGGDVEGFELLAGEQGWNCGICSYSTWRQRAVNRRIVTGSRLLVDGVANARSLSCDERADLQKRGEALFYAVGTHRYKRWNGMAHDEPPIDFFIPENWTWDPEASDWIWEKKAKLGGEA